MVKILGISTHMGVVSCGTDSGPRRLRSSADFHHKLAAAGIKVRWDPLMVSDDRLDPDPRTAELVGRIRNCCAAYAAAGQSFVAVGGDHASAMGIWSGTASHAPHGLLWIDAHLDAHNYDTTYTGNLHGMPVAALLGHRDRRLEAIYGSSISLDPARFVIMGVRSTEDEEWLLMARLGIRVYTMKAIRSGGGFAALLPRAIEQVSPRGEPFGVSVDLDAVDPADAPAVCTRVGGGVSGSDLVAAFGILNGDDRLLGLEIAEFTPERDVEQRTERLIAGMITAVYGDLA